MDSLYRAPAHCPHIGKDELTGFNPAVFKYEPTARDSEETLALKQKFNIANRRQSGVPISEPAVPSWNPMTVIADALTVSNTPGLIESAAKKDFDVWSKK
jgi:hypothetical protein